MIRGECQSQKELVMSRKLTALLALFLIGSSALYSQYCDSLATMVFTHPGATMLSIYENDTLDPGQIVPGYHFEFQNDSLRFEYNVREFRHNSRWVMLQTWCAERMYNWSSNTDSDTNELSSEALGTRSRTRLVSLLPGDTLSLLKESFWFYHDRDTAEYARLHAPKWFGVSVEIIDSANGQRIALLDSVRYASIGISVPCLELSTLMLDKLVYVHPTDALPKNVFIRVLLHEGEKGSGKWYRTDKIDYAFSKHELANGNRRGTLFTERIQKYNRCNLESESNEIHSNGMGQRTPVDVLDHWNIAPNTVIVYSVQGEKLFEWNDGGGSASLRSQLAHYPAGVVIAAVYKGSALMATVPIMNSR
jgi:hypothetical protein